MPYRILIVISSLQAGGAERVTTTLANYWKQIGHRITIVTFDSFNNKPFYEIDNDVEIVNLDLLSNARSSISSIKNNFIRIKSIRKQIKLHKPDIVISVMAETNILSIFSIIGVSTPLLIAEHSDPRVFPRQKYWKVLRSLLYPFSSFVVLLDKRFVSLYGKTIQNKCVVIPNPIAQINSKQLAQACLNDNVINIIAIGRFTVEKRFDVLLKSFSLIHKECPNTKLTILGDGPLRDELETIKSKLNLDESVAMPGVVKNINEYLLTSNIFILTSDSEGFPMVLCEAMSAGLPVVVSKYHSGVFDIVEDGVSGFIVDKGDVNAFKEKVSILINNEELMASIGSSAKEGVKRYSIESINNQWDKLFKELVHD